MRGAAAALLLAGAAANVDVIISAARALPPTACAHGCARWADLAGDGNTRDQADVNAKWRHGAPPAAAARLCAAPAYDPGESGPGWCYCAQTHDSSWSTCVDAPGSVPTQINLQFVDDAGATTVSFVTHDEGAHGGPPVAQVGTAPGGGGNVTGVTNFWTQVGSEREYSFHFVPLTGLAPATTYYYRVASGAAGAIWSDWYSYRTRDPAATLRIAIAGDVGPYPVNHFDLIANASTATDETRVDLLLHMGDHAYQMSSDDGARGDLYLLAFEAALTRLPWLAVMGCAAREARAHARCWPPPSQLPATSLYPFSSPAITSCTTELFS
jgi:hypothetical protein